ncbi:peritrophin-44-like [Teleopsis dalmanni]|uniref:peritrophin-44-like n=1 Tax=Teleopsis dalmanni TaxID=139649 RepID=UPI0018CCE739|nr:peritrophin-44-like [Teleopsis dalmanni]XP_037938343.1 peritrophin-44 [Teleopsis dalmanni]XP_037939059.1 peritrophin-44-like [Teleopsis dalmanni]
MTFAKPLLVLFIALFGLTAANVNTTKTPSVEEICAVMPPGSIILRPKTCTNWVRCSTTPGGEDKEEGSCVLGLYYNKDNGRCMYKDEVDCPYLNKIDTHTACTLKNDGAFLPDSNNCNGYIYCQNGTEIRAKCPSDLVFSPQKSACVYPHEYTCPKKPESAAISPVCRSVPDNSFFANEDECVNYYQCSGGVLTLYECDRDSAYDHIKGKCVPRDEVVCLPSAKKPEPESTICGTKAEPRYGYFPDGVSCSGYYICAKKADGSRDRDPKHIQCDEGLFFDPDNWTCRDRLNVKCLLDRCEGMGNKYVNIAGDCTSYARCSNGEAVSSGTCPSKYFFDERTQGCTPQNINYVACQA